MSHALALALALAVALAACGDEAPTGAAGRAGERPAVRVVATTPHAADFARSVGGERVAVRGLLPAGADAHDHEVRPSDVKALADAELIVRSGGELDAWLDEAVRGAGTQAPVVTLMDTVRPLGSDPHWWQDPRNVERAVATLRAALARADGEGARAYAANAQRYTARVRALDRAAARCLAAVPDAQRKLVTTHDAYGYYARRYRVAVVGTVIPSRSTQGQPSAGEIAGLVETIRREGVRAIFAEAAVDARVERAVAEQAGARVGERLWADTLGRPGSGADTWLGAFAADTRALVKGFTGGARSCSLPA